MRINSANVVVLDFGTFPSETRLRALSFPHRVVKFERTSPDQVGERIRDAHIVITNKVALTRASLEEATNLKLVAVAATGYNSIDVGACEQRGIAVCNVRDYATSTVPEHTFMLILALRRSLKAYDRSISRGRWSEANQFCYFDFPVHNLSGSTLGIIGNGTLGKAVGALAMAFGMNVVYAARKGGTAVGAGLLAFETVIAESDVISLHCPLTEATRNLIGTREFDAMRPSALLLNTARGGLVDEAALVRAIETGGIAGAGFDVTGSEPPGNDHPLVRLAERDNFILTPHVGWSSREAVQSLADQLIDNIEANWSGRPKNLVTAVPV